MQRRSFIGSAIAAVTGLLGLEKVKAEKKRLPEYPTNCTYELTPLYATDDWLLQPWDNRKYFLYSDSETCRMFTKGSYPENFVCYVLNQGRGKVVIEDVSRTIICILGSHQSVKLQSTGKELCLA